MRRPGRPVLLIVAVALRWLRPRRWRTHQFLEAQLPVAVLIERLQNRRRIRDLFGRNHTVVVRVQHADDQRHRRTMSSPWPLSVLWSAGRRAIGWSVRRSVVVDDRRRVLSGRWSVLGHDAPCGQCDRQRDCCDSFDSHFASFFLPARVPFFFSAPALRRFTIIDAGHVKRVFAPGGKIVKEV